MKISAVVVGCAALLQGAELKPQTVAAYDQYLATVTAQAREHQSRADQFLAFERLSSERRAQFEARVRRGETVSESVDPSTDVQDGLIHHWIGTAFIPGATIAQTFAVVRDYDSFAQNYRPEVVESKLLRHAGDEYEFEMRLRKHKVVTVIMNTVSEVHFGKLDDVHQYSVSRMKRIAEVEKVGTADERELPPGQDHGFMWRMDTFWRFEQVQEGVFIECEVISLTRDVPFGLKYLIGPFIQSIPRESLEFTMSATRNAVQQRVLAEHSPDGR